MKSIFALAMATLGLVTLAGTSPIAANQTMAIITTTNTNTNTTQQQQQHQLAPRADRYHYEYAQRNFYGHWIKDPDSPPKRHYAPRPMPVNPEYPLNWRDLPPLIVEAFAITAPIMKKHGWTKPVLDELTVNDWCKNPQLVGQWHRWLIMELKSRGAVPVPHGYGAEAVRWQRNMCGYTREMYLQWGISTYDLDIEDVNMQAQ